MRAPHAPRFFRPAHQRAPLSFGASRSSLSLSHSLFTPRLVQHVLRRRLAPLLLESSAMRVDLPAGPLGRLPNCIGAAHFAAFVLCAHVAICPGPSCSESTALPLVDCAPVIGRFCRRAALQRSRPPPACERTHWAAQTQTNAHCSHGKPVPLAAPAFVVVAGYGSSSMQGVYR